MSFNVWFSLYIIDYVLLLFGLSNLSVIRLLLSYGLFCGIGLIFEFAKLVD